MNIWPSYAAVAQANVGYKNKCNVRFMSYHNPNRANSCYLSRNTELLYNICSSSSVTVL